MQKTIAELDLLLQTSHEKPEILQFYNGEVTLYYDKGLHAYFEWTGNAGDVKTIRPSVTQVLGMIDKSGPLTQWAANSTVEYIRGRLPEFECVLGSEGLNDKYKDALPLERMEYRIRADRMKPLLEEARFSFRKISKDATDVGKVAHNWLEQYLKVKIANANKDTEMPLPEEERAAACVTAALDWMRKHSFSPKDTEVRICSRTLGVNGQLDFRGHIKSCGDHKCCPFTGYAHILGDFKSSKAIYPEYYAQTAAYQYAWEEEHPDKLIDMRLILRLDKEGDGFDSCIRTEETFETDMDAFQGALMIYNWNKQLSLNKKYEKALEREAKKEAKAKDKKPRKPRKTKNAPFLKTVGKKKETIEDIPVESTPSKLPVTAKVLEETT